MLRTQSKPEPQQTLPGTDNPAQPPKVAGTIERITFHNPESGYTVAKLAPEKGRDLVTIIGTFTSPVVGESLICEGTWTRHPEWGPQLSVTRYETVRPSTAAAIEKYLGSGLIKGVGKVTAKRIVAMFGTTTFDIIEREPKKMLAVAGLSTKQIESIQAAWVEQSEIRNIMVYLQSHDVSPLMADKIYKTYKDQAIAVVETNPYRLAYDIWGVGFSSADKIARNLGIALDDPRRIQAGLVYCMNQATERSGNVYQTRDQLAQVASELLGTHEIDTELRNLLEAQKLVSETVPFSNNDTALYIPSMLAAERGLSKRILALIEAPQGKEPSPQWLERTLAKKNLELTPEQHEAVQTALTSRVLVLTGGPGTGKTYTTQAIITALKAQNKTVQLASPTGRAAKRLSEVTGVDAATVHRLLAYDPNTRTFQFGQGAPLECDVLLIDEASMLDMPLAYAVLRAVKDTAQIILVGDVDQLPSVGPGNILRDLIDSGRVPVARLTTIFRQAAESRIVMSAHEINSGTVPALPTPREAERSGGDFVFIGADQAEDVADKIVAVVSISLPKRGIPAADVQVLTPMQRGSAGAAYLNQRLQETLNPKHPSKPEAARSGGVIFRLGDRVIQMRNNYDKVIFNGDIGVVKSIDIPGEKLTVKYADQEIDYDYTDLDELSLAYALSIHKSQGSEFPAIVIALHSQHFTLLQRQLIYTALTRARKFAVIVGSPKAVGIAVRNDKTARRSTLLKERLQGLL